jgi:hypothetical protein
MVVGSDMVERERGLKLGAVVMMGLLAKSADGDSTVRDRCRVSCDILCIAFLYDRPMSRRTIQSEKMKSRKMQVKLNIEWMKLRLDRCRDFPHAAGV